MKTLSAKVKTLSSKVATLCVATLLLTACGGGGGGGPAPIPSAPAPAPTQTLAPNTGMQKVAISLVVPVNTGTTGAKHREYISASAMGASIVVTQGSTTVNATLDLSASSSACTGSGSSRTCTTTVSAPTGSDVFTVTIYNQSPVNNAIPSGAAILGVGASTVNVIAGTTNSVQVYVGGEVAHFGATLPSGSLPANGHAQSAVLVIAPTDFGNNPITAGTNDPYANPITVAITESGGSGNATLSLNGGAASTSVLVTKSTDSVTVNYNGGGAPGYSFAITLSANGVSSQSSTVAPLIAAVNGNAVTSISLNGSAVGASQLGFGEAGSSSTYTATLASGCTGIATKGSISGSGASASLPLTGGGTPSASGCTLTISDGTISLVLPVTNTPVGASVSINGTQITEYFGYSHPFSITKGPDGNIWFTDQVIPSVVYAINPANASLVYTYRIPNTDMQGITTGSDGALWTSDQDLEGIDRITTAGVLTQYQLPGGGCPEGITSDSAGQLWVLDNCGIVWTLSVGGQFAQAANGLGPFSTPTNSITVGPDGAIWWSGDGNIGRYNPADSSTQEIPVPNSGSVVYLAAGTDGAIWYTANASSPAMFIGRIPMNGDGPFNTSTTFTVNVAQPVGAQMAGITAGADNAMWFVVSNNVNTNYIGEISLSSDAISTFPIPTTACGAWEITRGPDGSLWFTERNNPPGQIGRVIP
jgi:virginiamycin B lyase